MLEIACERGVISAALARSRGVKHGSSNPTLIRLEKAGWLESFPRGSRKDEHFYYPTAAGRFRLLAEHSRLAVLKHRAKTRRRKLQK